MKKIITAVLLGACNQAIAAPATEITACLQLGMQASKINSFGDMANRATSLKPQNMRLFKEAIDISPACELVGGKIYRLDTNNKRVGVVPLDGELTWRCSIRVGENFPKFSPLKGCKLSFDPVNGAELTKP